MTMTPKARQEYELLKKRLTACVVCGATERPMIWTDSPVCSENCAKELGIRE